MHFDVPKFVRSPGCDYGHDEESRNGRDVKIDIGRLYSDFGKVPSDSGIFPSTGELREYVLGLIGPYGKERGAA